MTVKSNLLIAPILLVIGLRISRQFFLTNEKQKQSHCVRAVFPAL